MSRKNLKPTYLEKYKHNKQHTDISRNSINTNTNMYRIKT